MAEPTTAPPHLSDLQRPSGAFAMLAVDQREALRGMFAEHTRGPVSDQHVTDFKIAATRILSPHASAVLIDRQFGWEPIVQAGVVDERCALIAAADHFESAHGELVGNVTIDYQVDPVRVRDQGARAMKLLVIYRPDTEPRERIAMVEEFIGRCHDAGLLSIIEPLSRAPVSGSTWDWDAGVLAAARELGSLGADLYKGEVPLHGQGAPEEIRRRCAEITAAVDSPWVVLSSGVPEDVFPTAVRLACTEGASGFLAGRAVWASSIATPDVEADLRTAAVARLQHLGEIVDDVVGEAA
ncbi:aldolase [Pseudactinotalea sp. Z1732]|uniref:aldolase n=1 Tax=Micrococcales TaxID=85006 RepID=UPI003C7E3FF2